MSRFLISAAHKSSGKTTVSLGICAALKQRGLSVQSFKKGPDYIDPLWLAMASHRNCYNLDFNTQSHQEILNTFQTHSVQADISVIEGNKGLYDGTDIEGSNCSAALALLLQAPVILVIDTQGITRSLAPLLLGFQSFDKQVNIAGVILNKVGGSRHESKLRAVVERYTDIPVLGAIQRDQQLEIRERHLGLIPSNETSQASDTIHRIASSITDQVDLDGLLNVAKQASTLPSSSQQSSQSVIADIKLGIARDTAFGFYYPDDIEALTAAGAEIIEIDTTKDKHLPDIDGLFIGGGFPETQMKLLEANQSLRHEIKQAIENGLPTYAECGGLMYLSRSITWKNQTCQMANVIPADVTVHDRPVGRGYTVLQENQNHLWPKVPESKNPMHAHEFHYSKLSDPGNSVSYAYDVVRGTGVIHHKDGIVYKNLLATYIHQRHVAANPWANRFVAFVRQTKQTIVHLQQTGY